MVIVLFIIGGSSRVRGLGVGRKMGGPDWEGHSNFCSVVET